MKAQFRATSPADAGAIAELLGKVFQAAAREPILDREMMEWKYWRERPGWPGSRSFVLERDGSMVAHGAAWPAAILSQAGRIPCFFLIDWAARSDFPGAGVSVMKHMAELVPVNFVYGGSEIALRMRAGMGYRPRNEVCTLALPLRPLRQILSSGRWGWKTPARLARNLLWSRADLRPATGWEARRTDPLEMMASGIPLPRVNSRALALERDPELFHYLGGCPLAPGEFFLVTRDARPAGYFCLTFPPGQARIADAWIDAGGEREWVQLYALAVGEAARHSDVNEITAAATGEAALAALRRCGFHARVRDPVQLYDPKKCVPPDLPLEVQLIDGDASFRNSGRPDYLT